jgi:hypothetical protein
MHGPPLAERGYLSVGCMPSTAKGGLPENQMALEIKRLASPLSAAELVQSLARRQQFLYPHPSKRTFSTPNSTSVRPEVVAQYQGLNRAFGSCCGAKSMDPSLSLTIAMWIWAILSIAAVIGSGTLAVLALREDEWVLTSLVLLCFAGSLGFLYFSTLILGQPVVAIWVWRALAGLAVGFGLLSCALMLRTNERRAPQILSMLGATIIVLILFVLSILGVATPADITLETTTTAGTSELISWHNVALTVLALGTLAFILLFVAATQNGIQPAIESHWGGLGGGFGGWRMSSSLSYLVCAVVFGALFSLLAVRDEGSIAKPMPAPMTKNAPTLSNDQSTSQPEKAPASEQTVK